MKTRYALLHILTALLSVFSVQTLYAQAKQDALYIFRNDGQFNAFFFGDIDRIEYSKIDTLGVEQADYVVQEVWALDTVYRIPISAIDSIAFVTPEKIIKADVFCPDKSIADYIVASDTINWIRLASNTPAAMIPKVGEKLLIEEKSQFIPRGFVGLVTSVENGSNGYTVMTGDLEITDVYERLVVKAAGATPLTGQTRRRGLFDGTELNYTSEEPIVFPDMSGSVSIQGSRVLYDKHDVSLTADGSGSLSFNFVPRIQYRGFLFVDVKYGLQYTQDITFDNKTSWDLMFTGSLTGNVDIPLKGIDKDFDAISLGVNCGLFINAQITGLTAGASWQSHYIGRDYLNNMIKDLSSILTDQGELIPAHKHSITFSEDSLSYTVSSQGKYAFSAGVYAKAEASFTLPFKKKEVKTKIGVRLEAGGRLTFEAPVWTPDVAYDLLTTTSVYQLLNKETNITASAYGKFSAYAQFNNQAWSANPEATLGSANLFGVVPNITSIEVVQDKEEPIRPYRFLFSSSTTNRKVPTLIPVGFAVFDANQKLEKDSINAYYWVGLKKDNWNWRNLTNAYNSVLNIDPGKGKEKTYIAYPMVEYLGYKILADKSKEFTVDPARIDIAQRELFVGADLGSMEIEVVPNMANMEVKVEGDWLNETKPIWLDHLNELNIYWPELPEDVKDRRGVVRLTGKSQKGEVLVEDSIVVHQYVPFVEVTPSKMVFEAKGGTQTATITKTNLTDLKVISDYDYIHSKLEGNVITVMVDENKDADARGSSNGVCLEGKKPNGETIIMPVIYIDQEGSGASPQEPVQPSNIKQIRLDFRCFGIDDKEKVYKFSSWDFKKTIDSEGDELTEYGVWWDAEHQAEFTLTPKGSGYTVSAFMKKEDSDATEDSSISFDLDEISWDEDGNLQCKNLTNLKIKHVVNYQTGGVQTTEIEINALPDYKYWGIRKDDHEAVWNVYDYPITRFMYHTERSNGTVQQHMDTYNGLYYGIENYFSIGMTLDP